MALSGQRVVELFKQRVDEQLIAATRTYETFFIENIQILRQLDLSIQGHVTINEQWLNLLPGTTHLLIQLLQK